MWLPTSSASLGNRERVGENTGTGLRISRNLPTMPVPFASLAPFPDCPLKIKVPCIRQIIRVFVRHPWKAIRRPKAHEREGCQGPLPRPVGDWFRLVWCCETSRDVKSSDGAQTGIWNGKRQPGKAVLPLFLCTVGDNIEVFHQARRPPYEETGPGTLLD
jgi:hypothetical protein